MKNIFLIPLLIVIDQAIKFLIKNKIFVVLNFPIILYKENFGAAFSLFLGERLFLMVASFVIIGLIFYYYNKYKTLKFGFDFILAGSISNLIDRIFRGYVVDYINIGLWPVFNLADIYNLVGVLIIIFILKKKSLKNLLKKIKRE